MGWASSCCTWPLRVDGGGGDCCPLLLAARVRMPPWLLVVLVILAVVVTILRAGVTNGQAGVEEGAGLVKGVGAVRLGDGVPEEESGGSVAVTNGEVEG